MRSVCRAERALSHVRGACWIATCVSRETLSLRCSASRAACWLEQRISSAPAHVAFRCGVGSPHPPLRKANSASPAERPLVQAATRLESRHLGIARRAQLALPYVKSSVVRRAFAGRRDGHMRFGLPTSADEAWGDGVACWEVGGVLAVCVSRETLSLLSGKRGGLGRANDVCRAARGACLV